MGQGGIVGESSCGKTGGGFALLKASFKASSTSKLASGAHTRGQEQFATPPIYTLGRMVFVTLLEPIEVSRTFILLTIVPFVP